MIGEVAVSGKHKWMFSDAHSGEWDSISSQDVQNDSDFHHQFLSGIQTIAIVPVESRGVVQFGSTQKMLESFEFLDQTRRSFQEMENLDGVMQLENMPPSLNSESCDLNEIFASLISSGNCFTEILASAHGGNSRELMGNPCSLANVQSTTFASDLDYEMINPLDMNSSSYLSNQSQTAGGEFLQSTFSVKNSVANTPCISTWSEEGSILTSLEQPFSSESIIQHTLQGESMLTSIYSAEGLVDMEKTIPKMTENQHSAQFFLETEGELPEIANNLNRLTEEFKLSDLGTDLSSSCIVDDLPQWFAHSPDHSFHRLGTIMNNNLLQSGAAPVSTDIPIKHPCNSVQSSLMHAFTAHGQEKFNIVHGAENDLFEGLGLDFGCAQAGKHWEEYRKPDVRRGGGSAFSTCMSECITELDVGSTTGPRKGLFSELGLQELLNSVTNSGPSIKCDLEDQLSATKRRKVESSSSNSNDIQWTKLPCSDASTSLLQAVYNQDAKNVVCRKDVLPKSQVGLWIDDSYSINAEKAAAASPKKPEKPIKVSKKRARPGDSTRPRPKDRQQIQDRLKELRGIIPNGAKCSIDCLLDLTIKHMLFLQSITKYADQLKAAEEPKLVGQKNGVVLKNNSAGGNNSGGGATWAYEIGGQTMMCPIIVEDLNPPGQMLIEMLCEDRGFFLEIADMIRSFGLSIWKGLMEHREDKIWARFIVEANKHVTRMDIFWSLVQLLQQTNTNTIDSMNQPKNETDDKIPLLDGYQQNLLPVAVSHQLG
ncbi:Transcription factor LHW [Melia azedarach]|nr:Transcription factor LHW [Melia azedarach]